MHAALFGSRARGDDRPDSDTDIMIEVAPDVRMTVYDYVGLKDYIASLFDGRVDVVSRDGLKPYVRPAVTADAIYASSLIRRATWRSRERRATCDLDRHVASLSR